MKVSRIDGIMAASSRGTLNQEHIMYLVAMAHAEGVNDVVNNPAIINYVVEEGIEFSKRRAREMLNVEMEFSEDAL